MKKILILFLSIVACVSSNQSKGVIFKKSAKIAFIGNGYAERMRFFNYLEAAIYANQSEDDLVVRNLAVHADQVDLQARGSGTQSLLKNLSWVKPNVVFAFWGMNESFQGEKGLDKFKQKLNEFLGKLKRTLKDVQIILVSPIAHEYLLNEAYAPKSFVKKHNKNLEKYVKKMKKIAQMHNIQFIDLFKVSQQLYKENKANLTYNGIHQNELGDFLFSREITKSLAWYTGEKVKEVTKGQLTTEYLKKLYTKNYYYFMAYRPTNTVHLWGSRYKAWAKDKPLFELEQIMRLVDKIDKELWNIKKPTIEQLFSKAPSTKGAELWENIFPDRKDIVDIKDIKIPRKEILRNNSVFFKFHKLNKQELR